jgi:hypothetical protein
LLISAKYLFIAAMVLFVAPEREAMSPIGEQPQERLANQ